MTHDHFDEKKKFFGGIIQKHFLYYTFCAADVWEDAKVNDTKEDFLIKISFSSNTYKKKNSEGWYELFL